MYPLTANFQTPWRRHHSSFKNIFFRKIYKKSSYFPAFWAPVSPDWPLVHRDEPLLSLLQPQVWWLCEDGSHLPRPESATAERVPALRCPQPSPAPEFTHIWQTIQEGKQTQGRLCLCGFWEGQLHGHGENSGQKLEVPYLLPQTQEIKLLNLFLYTSFLFLYLSRIRELIVLNTMSCMSSISIYYHSVRNAEIMILSLGKCKWISRSPRSILLIWLITLITKH